MYDRLRDKEVDDALLRKTECCVADAVMHKNEYVCSCCGMPAKFASGYSKEQQLSKGRIKPKKESTFGKASKGGFGKTSKGTFGKKQTVWNKNKKSTKPKVKKSDVISENFLKWLAQKACVVTGINAQRGAGGYDLHIHHINSRNKGRNDFLTVPLMGYVHSWGELAYHSNAENDYIKKNKLMVENIKVFFLENAQSFIDEYFEQGNMLLSEYEQIAELIEENIEKYT